MAAFEDEEFGDWDEQDFGAQWNCNLCRFKNNVIMPVCEICGLKRGDPAPAADGGSGAGQEGGEGGGGAEAARVVATLRSLLTGEATLLSLQRAQQEHPGALSQELGKLLDLDVAVSSATLTRAAAVLHGAGEHHVVDRCLAKFSVAEVLAFIKFLDAPRKARQLRRKVEVLKSRNAGRRKVRQLESSLGLMEREGLLESGTFTGSLARKVKRKIAAIPADKLEFYLLVFPFEPWLQLADLCHFKPSEFALPYFLASVHGEPAPAGSLVGDFNAWATGHDGAADANAALSALLDKHANLYTMFSAIRVKTRTPLDAEVKRKLAARAPLEDVLWFYEELAAEGVEAIVTERLARGESVDAGRGRANYGKLMERLLFFKREELSFAPLLMTYAEQRLTALAEDHAQRGGHKVAVLGDASGSMEVAINTSTILGSLLSVCLDAELVFFNRKAFPPPCVPASAADVLCITQAVIAKGTTSPAAALWPFYESRKKVDLFIVVSDEEENTKCHGNDFASLFAKYRAEVNPGAGCFLVSFLSGPATFLGKMNAELRTKGYKARQFRLNLQRPDLSKLPNLLAMLRLELSDLPPSGGAPKDGKIAEAAEAAEVEAGRGVTDQNSGGGSLKPGVGHAPSPASPALAVATAGSEVGGAAEIEHQAATIGSGADPAQLAHPDLGPPQ